LLLERFYSKFDHQTSLCVIRQKISISEWAMKMYTNLISEKAEDKEELEEELRKKKKRN
jgi:hypothetical protein